MGSPGPEGADDPAERARAAEAAGERELLEAVARGLGTQSQHALMAPPTQTQALEPPPEAEEGTAAAAAAAMVVAVPPAGDLAAPAGPLAVAAAEDPLLKEDLSDLEEDKALELLHTEEEAELKFQVGPRRPLCARACLWTCLCPCLAGCSLGVAPAFPWRCTFIPCPAQIDVLVEIFLQMTLPAYLGYKGGSLPDGRASRHCTGCSCRSGPR